MNRTKQKKRLWVNRQEVEDGYKGIEKVMKKLKISLLMSLVFAEEICSQGLLDFLFYTDFGRISEVVKEVENLNHEESSEGGVQKLMLFFGGVSCVLGGRGYATLLLCLYVTEEAGRKYVEDLP